MNAPRTISVTEHHTTSHPEPLSPVASSATQHRGQLLEIELTVASSTASPAPFISVTISSGPAADLAINMVRVGVLDRGSLAEWLADRGPAAFCTGPVVWQHVDDGVVVGFQGQQNILAPEAVGILRRTL